MLVVSGEFDDLTTPHEGKVVAELFPDSEQFIARNAGHVDALYASNGDAARNEIRDVPSARASASTSTDAVGDEVEERLLPAAASGARATGASTAR